MKQGEKAALWFAAAILIGVGALTAYLESQMKDGSQSQLISNVAQQLRPTGSTEVASIGLIPQGLNPYDLPDPEGHGAALLTIYCTQCHDLPSPAMHSAQTWPAVLQRMDQHMQQQRLGAVTRIAIPARTNWADLGEYLSQYGQTIFKPTDHNDLDSPESQQFQQTCAQCHTLPSPDMHPANEWPRTVLRMKHHIRKADKSSPDDHQTQLIVTYLQKHAAQSNSL